VPHEGKSSTLRATAIGARGWADKVKLIGYRIGDAALDIRPAPATRSWMDQLPEAFAYRCLPLNIANAHGWEVGSPCGFTARWDGGGEKDAITINHQEGEGELPLSHFGFGVLTFHVPILFRSPPGTNMMVTGPLNQPKHGIAALSGIIESDWAPYGFTMNWKFTAPGVEVSWKRGEAFLFFFLLQRGMIEAVEPEILPLESNPELAETYRLWRTGRLEFNRALEESGSQAQRERWQKHYYRGALHDGDAGPPEHQMKLRVKPFKA